METISLIINTSKDGEEKEHKAFLKSLGIKSDSVGWCELNLDDSDAKDNLDKICKYAKEKFRSVRIWYEWKEDYEDSDWYIYKPKHLSVDIKAWKDIKISSALYRDGGTYHSIVDGINAYKIPKNISIIMFDDMKATSAIVSEKFRECVENNGLTEMQFVWAKDKGRYQAPDYYRVVNMSVYNDNNIFISLTESYEKIRRRKKYLYGPNWPWLAEYNLVLDHLSVPPLFKGEIPIVDITEWTWGFILSKKAAQCMLNDKLILKEDLSPCRFVNEVPDYYEPLSKHFSNGTCVETVSEKLSGEEMLEIQKEYEKFSKKERPIREVKQKEVLKALKNAKKENPDDFLKPLKKSERETLVGTQYEVLLPYLSISDGMWFEDIDILSFEDMKTETVEYLKCRTEEEVMELPEGIQIGVSGGGDYIILTSGKVVRYSHEDWTVENEWKNIDLFVMELIDGIE